MAELKPKRGFIAGGSSMADDAEYDFLACHRSSRTAQVDARLIFLWSRIRGCDDYSDRAERQMRTLMFEDFLEAIVRVAALVALPTDEEINESGAADAGQYLLTLEEQARPPHVAISPGAALGIAISHMMAAGAALGIAI